MCAIQKMDANYVVACIQMLQSCNFQILFVPCSSRGQLIYTHRDLKSPVLAAVLRGSSLAVGTSNGKISLLHIVSGQVMRAVQGHDRAVTALATEEVEG